MNELVEECKDYTVKEMKPTLDILFNAYDYEKKQHQIMDTLSAEEYDRVVKALKVNRTMGLRLKSDTTCCCCGKSLIQTMDNGLKDKVVLFWLRTRDAPFVFGFGTMSGGRVLGWN